MSLISHFRATDYRCGAVTLRVGRRSLAVDQLLARRRARSCAFITACSPFSNRTSDGINKLRSRELRRDLSSRGFAFDNALGQGYDWPAEESVLVFGISRPEASAIGRRYRQDAIVYARRDRPAELILLRWLS